MVLTDNQGDKPFEQIPKGTWIARLFQIIDLGTQVVSFAGEEKEKRQVRLFWELLDTGTKMADGRPMVKAEKYTASWSKKSNLYQALIAMGVADTKTFDLKNALGMYCQLSIVHNEGADGTIYANIASFAPLHASMVKPAGVNELRFFDLDSDDALADYQGLGQKIKDVIAKSPEFKRLGAPKETVNHPEFKDDTIPF